MFIKAVWLLIIAYMEINQSVSFYVRHKVSRKTAKKGAIVLQVTIDGTMERIPLEISWPTGYFDDDTELLKPRFANDELCIQNNFKIRNEKSKAEKLHFRLYALGSTINHELVRKELGKKISRDDVIQNFRYEANELFDKQIAKPRTYKNYTTVFNRMDRYFETKPRWKFNNLNLTDLLELEVWIRENLSHNSVAGTMRVLHKFMKISKKNGLLAIDPFDEYKMPGFNEGIREPLEPIELKTMTNFYFNGNLTTFESDVLRRYLISCYTGLRKSDIEQLDPRFHIRNGNILRLHMFKTRKYGKIVEFNMPQIAEKLIGKKRGQLFPEVESGLLCKTLRTIAFKAGIYKYMKFHSGRDTFASIYLELNGNVVDLQEILGHSDLKTTMIYIKMKARTKNVIMAKFDNL
ncbi:tyrosine-type recombinase/integrase [Sphingobacterium spiritivorum]|uniref:tyrosine-type recombinase/integrase n=1 Tax=Sphingobacterium spiritivorum TaxID=258 RepID=UPI003DA27F97